MANSTKDTYQFGARQPVNARIFRCPCCERVQGVAEAQYRGEEPIDCEEPTCGFNAKVDLAAAEKPAE